MFLINFIHFDFHCAPSYFTLKPAADDTISRNGAQRKTFIIFYSTYKSTISAYLNKYIIIPTTQTPTTLTIYIDFESDFVPRLFDNIFSCIFRYFIVVQTIILFYSSYKFDTKLVFWHHRHDFALKLSPVPASPVERLNVALRCNSLRIGFVRSCCRNGRISISRRIVGV